MEKMNCILRKCKSLSKMGRSSSYGNFRSKSSISEAPMERPSSGLEESPSLRENEVMVFVGSGRRAYVINAKYLNHPLLSTLLEISDGDDCITVKCEVVLFDHLLWTLENVDLDITSGEESLEELADLYAY